MNMSAANEIAVPGGDLVPFRGQMISRADIPRSSRVRPVVVDSMDDALRYAKVIAASGMLPKSFYESAGGDPTAMAFVAIQLGAEVGLSPMASVQNIAVINGKPGLYGPAMLAVVETSGLLEVFEEWIEGEGETLVAFCKVRRRGRPEKIVPFGWGDAKKAGLNSKRGPWQEYPKRMMQARARTFALRDTFPDVLLGLAYSIDELQDINTDPVRPAVVHAPDPDPMPAPAEPIPTKSEEVPAKAAKSPLVVYCHDGSVAEFPRTGAGLQEAMKLLNDSIEGHHPEVVGVNYKLLDWISKSYPAMADDIAEMRAAAVMATEALAPDPDPDPDPDDAFPGDLPDKSDS